MSPYRANGWGSSGGLAYAGGIAHVTSDLESGTLYGLRNVSPALDAPVIILADCGAPSEGEWRHGNDNGMSSSSYKNGATNGKIRQSRRVAMDE